MKEILIALLIAGLFIGGAVYFTRGNNAATDNTSEPVVSNVSEAEGKQVIEITAKGGYSPRVTSAKAGVPTVLKVKTNSTFDCSIALRIASLGFKKNLPPTGVTEIEVPPQAAGTKLQGICAMGMYSFAVNFN